MEQAPPTAREDVDRGEPRPEHPRQLAADDQADLSLVSRQEVAGGVLVARMNPGQEAADVVARHLVSERIADRHGAVSFLDRESLPMGKPTQTWLPRRTPA